jgi:hypothetical protein
MAPQCAVLTKGPQEGEQVLASVQFLIDSEARLRQGPQGHSGAIEWRGHDDLAEADRQAPGSRVQRLGEYAMVQGYAHFAADHLAPWAERLVSLRDDRGTNPSQPADVPSS